MSGRWLRGVLGSAFLALAALTATGCTTADEDVGTDRGEVNVDTRSAIARRQYDANVAFANAYTPRCKNLKSSRPRVLLTGFGRFMSITDNATGRIVSKVVPLARYPETRPPAAGDVDDPAPQLSVATSTVRLETVGDVEICAMILPVYWDLAAILVAKELEEFDPAFVLMNGVAGSRQPIWIELGALNRAAALDDGSSQLRPLPESGDEYAKIVGAAPASEDARGNLLSWEAVRSRSAATVRRLEDEIDPGDRVTKFGDILRGVKIAGYPRESNTYLCNNITYVTGYLMSHPGEKVTLLQANPPVAGKVNEIDVTMKTDLGTVPRVFVHWPSELANKHHDAGAEVMKAIIDAQLDAIARGDAPTKGDNRLADPSLRGGATF